MPGRPENGCPVLKFRENSAGLLKILTKFGKYGQISGKSGSVYRFAGYVGFVRVSYRTPPPASMTCVVWDDGSNITFVVDDCNTASRLS